MTAVDVARATVLSGIHATERAAALPTDQQPRQQIPRQPAVAPERAADRHAHALDFALPLLHAVPQAFAEPIRSGSSRGGTICPTGSTRTAEVGRGSGWGR